MVSTTVADLPPSPMGEGQELREVVWDVAFTLAGEAGGLGLPGLYGAAYVMLCRMRRALGEAFPNAVPAEAWREMLDGTRRFRSLGGWSAYRKAVRDRSLAGHIQEYQRAVKVLLDNQVKEGKRRHPLPAAYELARLMVLGRITPQGLAALAEDDVGLSLDGDMLYCMSAQDVEGFSWEEGEIVILRGPWALHLYSHWPQEREYLAAEEEAGGAGDVGAVDVEGEEEGKAGQH